jgi:hypothetical protein
MLYNAQKHLLFAITLLFGLTVQAEDIIAKTIYSEASPICSFKERYLIASVISNRINHKGFYSLKTAEQVVSHPNAFEAYTSKNSNWTGYDKLNNKAKQEAKRLSLAIQSNKFHPIENIHFFVTKGFKVPSTFYSKKYWTLNKVCSTKHFDFFSITSK